MHSFVAENYSNMVLWGWQNLLQLLIYFHHSIGNCQSRCVQSVGSISHFLYENMINIFGHSGRVHFCFLFYYSTCILFSIIFVVLLFMFRNYRFKWRSMKWFALKKAVTSKHILRCGTIVIVLCLDAGLWTPRISSSAWSLIWQNFPNLDLGWGSLIVLHVFT